jgi:hypothetical protein
VPESLSEIIAGVRISGEDGEDEVNKAEEMLPGLNLNDLDVSSNDNSSNDSFLDISEASSSNDDNWSASSPEQAIDKMSHCLWSHQKSGELYILSGIHINPIMLHIVLYSFRPVLFLSESTSTET